MISFKISSYEEYEPYRDTYDDSTYCCFCKKSIEHKKEGDWYWDSAQPVISKSFLIFCNDICLNCYILQKS